MPENFKTGFLKTLCSIRDYLPEIVIGGGWVPLIYYHYLLGDKSKDSIRTIDIDLMVKDKLPVIGSKTLDQLLMDAGLKSVFKTLYTPPIIHYEGTIDDCEVEIEFLTDKKGSKEDVVIEVQKGLHAEALQYISIALENVIEVEIDDFPVEGNTQHLRVKVPSPEAYILHKGLVFTRRKEKAKMAKDLFYIFDVLVNGSEIEGQIINGFKSLKVTYPKWFKNFVKNLEVYFSDLMSEGVFLVSSQRPVYSLPALNDDQFKQYVHGTFRNLIEKIKYPIGI